MAGQDVEQPRDLRGDARAHEHVVDAGEHGAVGGGRRGHLHLLEEVHAHQAVVALAREPDLGEVGDHGQLERRLAGPQRQPGAGPVRLAGAPTTLAEVALQHALGHRGHREGGEGAAQVAAGVAVLQPAGEHGVEGGARHDAELAGQRDLAREPPRRDADAHPALDELREGGGDGGGVEGRRHGKLLRLRDRRLCRSLLPGGSPPPRDLRPQASPQRLSADPAVAGRRVRRPVSEAVRQDAGRRAASPAGALSARGSLCRVGSPVSASCSGSSSSLVTLFIVAVFVVMVVALVKRGRAVARRGARPAHRPTSSSPGSSAGRSSWRLPARAAPGARAAGRGRRAAAHRRDHRGRSTRRSARASSRTCRPVDGDPLVTPVRSRSRVAPWRTDPGARSRVLCACWCRGWGGWASAGRSGLCGGTRR